jgi:hypothetical protein
MSDESKISINLAPLAKLRGDLAKKIVAKVGIRANTGPHTLAANQSTPGKKASPIGLGSITNVQLGVIHEFGSADGQHPPPRSFLRMPMEVNKKELVKFLETGNMKALIVQGEVAKVLKLLGVKGETIVQRAFDSGGFGRWKGLADSTVRAKGSSTILVDTGQLRRAVSSWVGAK